MKRQATISSFFAKKPAEKKPKLSDESTPTSTFASTSASVLVSAPASTVPTPMEVDTPALSTASTSKIAQPALSKQEIATLHAKFSQKFGDLDKEKTLKRQRVEKLMTEIGEGKEEIIPHQKFTPLETQVVELKAKYPGCLLLIEVGYKFRFFGEDAKIASRILHIANFIDRNFYVASVPVHRLNFHVQKLVKAGYKVGIVRQTETAALKAAGSNKSQPFQRELQQMVTKGTVVDDMINVDAASKATNSGYLMCLVEEKRGGNGPDERVYTGMISIQPSTGDIVYDTFEDTYMRAELETRLMHIEPSEILVPSELSKPTEKLVKHLSLQKSTTFGEESVRIERMPSSDTFCTDYNAALTYVSDFYASTNSLGAVVALPEIIIKALACIIRYLDEFNLTSVLKNTKFFTHFVSTNHMLLNGNTLLNLEIYRNNTNFREKGSLFSILNHTHTRFGQRMLRKWVGRPLVDIERLKERTDAVEEMIRTENPKKNLVLSLLPKLPDIEKGLCRIHYGKSTPKELIEVLNALVKVSSAFLNTQEPRFSSDLLNRLFDALPSIHKTVVDFRDSINLEFDKKEDKTSLFKSEERWPEIPREKKNIKYAESLLLDHLEELKQSTGMDGLKYVSVAGLEYLVEVSNSKTKKVPNHWIKISGTKAVSRYQDKYIMEQMKEREQHKELLLISAEKAYKDFMAEIAEHYEHFREVVACLAHLDCLLSLSVTAGQPGYVRPAFAATGETKVEVVKGRHPIVEHLINSYVPNDIRFSGDQKTMILTGPNMGGKSSYIRQIALIAIMGQIGSYVPATSATLSILDAVYTRMGASDNMMRGESTFMVELHETSDIMRHATDRSLVILDELGRGTSTHDGQAIAYAVLNHFILHIKSITLFVTHYPSLGKIAKSFPDQVRNCYVSYIQEESSNSDVLGTDIVFLYKLVDGIATNSYGMNVARLANLPLSVIQVAKQKSDEMRQEMEERQLQKRKMHILKTLMQEPISVASKKIKEELLLL